MSRERAGRIYELLLHCFPRRLRTRFGGEMRRLFLDSWREAQGRRALFWARTLADVATNGIAARFGRLEGFRAYRASGRPRQSPTRHVAGNGGTMDSIAQDLAYGLRSLVRAPAMTVVIVLTLALGIGANTAIYSVIDGVLLRPLPFEEPDELVALWQNDRLRGTTQEWASGPDFLDWQERATSYVEMAGLSDASFVLTGPDLEPRQLSGYSVSHNLFSLLGREPMRGRGFTAEDDRMGAERVTILAYSLWQNAFGGRDEILGEPISLDGLPYTVVGIMPPGFDVPDPDTGLWVPIQSGPYAANMGTRGNHGVFVVARLRAGVTVAQATTELETIMAALETAYADDNLGRSGWAEPLHETFVSRVRPNLIALLVAVGLVLLIACANVASLLVARAASREREVAVRGALGASRTRLVRQFLTESLMLAFAGGLFGLVLAFGLLRGLLALAGPSLPRAANVAIDLRVLAFTFAVCVTTGLLFGLVPALQATRARIQERLYCGGRSGTSRARHRLRRTLVVGELALAVLVLVGAGLVLRSLWRLQSVDPGFRADGLLAVSLTLPPASYPQDFANYPNFPEVRQFYRDLLERVRSLPGVESAVLAAQHPFEAGWTTRFTIVGRPEVDPGEQDEIRIRPVTPGYFRTTGTPVLQGRELLPSDREDAPLVALVNEAVVRAYFPEEDPIGQQIKLWRRDYEIVGVVGDVKFRGLDRAGAIAFYPSLEQLPMGGFSLVVRTPLEPQSLVPAIQDEIWAIDPNLPIASVEPLERAILASLSPARFNTIVLALFAGIALLLASIGIYGVVSQGVHERTQEIGLRMSLGARRGDILGLVVSQGLVLAVVGLGLGLAGAMAGSRLLESLLFGTSARDAATLAAVAVVLAGVALLASYLPARRASRVDPSVALRHE